MSVAAPTSPHPPLRRDSDHRVIAGVAGGLARRVGIEPLAVRILFVLLAALSGVGVPLYLAGWIALPADDGTPSVASRVQAGSAMVAAGAGCLALAALLALRELGVWWSDAITWPLVLAAGGVALLWRQATQRGAIVPPLARRSPRAEAPAAAAASDRARLRAGRREAGTALRATYQGGFGVALVAGAILLFLQSHGALNGARDLVLSLVVVGLGLGLVLAPFWVRLVRGLAAERAERIRSQERAEVAAHLHDSVLQTLALIQKQSGDPRAVATLARSQERALRGWLSGAPEARPDDRLADALRVAAAEVETAHGAPIDVVIVGDRDLDDRHRALVAAAREALANAARHAGATEPIALYAEVQGNRAEVFVRDRGQGFDVAAVPADRHGVRESIIGRMARHGGRALVHSAPGGGTEVELVLEERGG